MIASSKNCQTVLLCVAGLFGLVAVLVQGAPRPVSKAHLTFTPSEKAVFRKIFLAHACQRIRRSLNVSDSSSLETSLTTLQLGPKLSSRGFNNHGIFSVSGTYAGHAGKDLLVKIVKRADEVDEPVRVDKDTPVEAASIGEVKALKRNRQYVASGMLKDRQILGTEAMPVIVMIRQPGDVLVDDKDYQHASEPEKEEMRREAIR
ncbi:hypothetical protein GYMLUDRAFT_55694 [Collybiopsis luxurians FD-317 M1]|nr:hypothetical protein GYMLUDRAFT_55694 [Collybiopsis luxurians FD-317 M1]